MVLSPEEILKIIQDTEPFYRAFFLCLYTLGLRMNEARQLKWEDIDFHSRSVRIQQKGGSRKLFPLPEWTADAIREIPQKDDHRLRNEDPPLVQVRAAVIDQHEGPEEIINLQGRIKNLKIFFQGPFFN